MTMTEFRARASFASRAYLSSRWALGADAMAAIGLLVWWLT